MPKEQIRKRGKRKPKTEAEYGAEHEAGSASAPAPLEQVFPESSSGIHPSRLAILRGEKPTPPTVSNEGTAEGGQNEEGTADWTRGPRDESEYPFGILDPDVKAYFRNLEDQIKDWEGASSVGEEREDRQLFLVSVLNELRGSELQVATDPDTAVVLERLLPSLNDWGRRVIGDAVGDNWETLVRHRFGSHVAQTWLSLAAGTLDREHRGVFPPQEKEQKTEDEGMLPRMTSLVKALVASILPTIPTLLTNAHASPPIRLLLLVLTPHRALPSLDSASLSVSGGSVDLIRSKRSGKFRKGQGVQGKSILGDEEDSNGKGKGKGKQEELREVPDELSDLREVIRMEVMKRVQPVEWQSMGVDRVGSAAVQLLLEMEVERHDISRPESLMNVFTDGLVCQLESDPLVVPTSQSYLSSIILSPTGTHLVEAILRLAPPKIFAAIWESYFDGKLGKLAGHPYANFVVSRGVARIDAARIRSAVSEIKSVSGGRGLIKAARTSVLLALVERVTELGDAQDDVVDLIKSTIELPLDQSVVLVPCIMTLKTYPIYQALLTGAELADDDDAPPAETVDNAAEAAAQAAARRSAWENRRQARPRGALEPNMQGCLLLQAMVSLPGNANTPVLDSLFAQTTDALMLFAKSPIASHLLDKVLTSPGVSPKYRRKLYNAFMGRYRELAEDRLGSRVADTIWDTADGFMREKIARSLIPEANALANSQFGRFLARRLNLHLLARRPEEWREAQLGVKHHFAHQKPAVPVAESAIAAPTAEAPPVEEEGKRRKRKERKEHEEDEIDELFATVEVKKKKSSQI